MPPRVISCLLISGVIGLASCGSSTPTGPPEPLTKLPRPLTPSETQALRSSNAFAFDLLREVVAEEEPGTNLFVSPLSVSMAVGMALNGASGETFEGMRQGLGLNGMAADQINQGYRGLLDLLLSLDSTVEMTVANSVWSRQGFSFEGGFFDVLRTYFGAEARVLDFADPGAKDIINGWVKTQTNDRIDSIVESISPLDILFLVNAVYFKGEWTSQFDPANTRPRPFYPEAGDPVDVPAMSGQNARAGSRVVDGVHVAELPYGAEAFSMVVVQPAGDQTLADLVATADDARWLAWTEGIGFDEVPVQLPKFELTYDIRLNDPLIRMGMGAAFDRETADFSKLTADPTAHISRVQHKTFLKVDEVGSEAAAATSVGISVTSAPDGITVDRPFLVAIRERLSGAILFVGMVYDPTG